MLKPRGPAHGSSGTCDGRGRFERPLKIEDGLRKPMETWKKDEPWR